MDEDTKREIDILYALNASLKQRIVELETLVVSILDDTTDQGEEYFHDFV